MPGCPPEPRTLSQRRPRAPISFSTCMVMARPSRYGAGKPEHCRDSRQRLVVEDSIG